MALNTGSTWTRNQNKLLKVAVAEYGIFENKEHTPEMWVKIAKAVGAGKTVDDVKKQYELLVESGQIAIPDYPDYEPIVTKLAEKECSEALMYMVEGDESQELMCLEDAINKLSYPGMYKLKMF